jgi:hypothetical protein
MTQRHRGDEDSHKQEDSHQEDSHRWASGLRRMVHYIVDLDSECRAGNRNRVSTEYGTVLRSRSRHRAARASFVRGTGTARE